MPKESEEVPACPDHLHGEARVEWERVSQLLTARGLISKVDRAGLAVYCQALARWVEAETKLQEGGLIVKSPNGYPIQNPYLSIANHAAREIHRSLAEFGLSPTARKGLPPADPDQAAIDELSELSAEQLAVLLDVD